jgi:hypothetical protein
MNRSDGQQPSPHPEETSKKDAVAQPRSAWSEPKLLFVEPVLRKQGDLLELTGQGFFGTIIVPDE